MNIYHYDNAGIYTHSTTAKANPKQVGDYLIPAKATSVQPDDCGSGYVNVFDGGAWVATEDHRGESGYVDGVECTICEVGPLPDEWTETPPPGTCYTWSDGAWVEDVDSKWSEVRSQRNALLTECDYTQVSDNPLCGDSDYVAYRQALRDITAQEDPFNIVWPDKPE